MKNYTRTTRSPYGGTQESAPWKLSGWALDQWPKKHLMKTEDKGLAVCETPETKSDNRAQDNSSTCRVLTTLFPKRVGNRCHAEERGGRGVPNHRVTFEPRTDLRRQQGWSNVVNRMWNELWRNYTKIIQRKILPLVKTSSVFSWKRILPLVLHHENNKTLSKRHRFLTTRKYRSLKNMLLPARESRD